MRPSLGTPREPEWFGASAEGAPTHPRGAASTVETTTAARERDARSTQVWHHEAPTGAKFCSVGRPRETPGRGAAIVARGEPAWHHARPRSRWIYSTEAM